MDGRELMPFLQMVSERYERASEARDDLIDRLETLNRRSRDVRAVTEASLAVGSPPHEADDIHGARAVLYRSSREWMDRTQAMEAIIGSLVSQIHEESRFRWPTSYDTAPLPSTASQSVEAATESGPSEPSLYETAPLPGDSTIKYRPPEPTRGGWSAPSAN
jgi:hypothetical protein